MGYAVFATGGKQYRVSPGDVIEVERLDAEASGSLTFDEVLLVTDEDGVQRRVSRRWTGRRSRRACWSTCGVRRSESSPIERASAPGADGWVTARS